MVAITSVHKLPPVQMRIATWNLRRPGRNPAAPRNLAILEKIKEINADIWILTETADPIQLDGYQPAVLSKSNPQRYPYHRVYEQWVAVWSRYRITDTFETSDSNRAVCVQVETVASPLWVYGLVLPWQGDCGPAKTSKGWTEFYQAVPQVGADWHKLGDKHPICVAGDFNHTLSGPRYYHTEKGRRLLSDSLTASNLECVTADIPNNLDHICLSKSWAEVNEVGSFQGYYDNGKPVSDHIGVFVGITINGNLGR